MFSNQCYNAYIPFKAPPQTHVHVHSLFFLCFLFINYTNLLPIRFKTQSQIVTRPRTSRIRRPQAHTHIHLKPPTNHRARGSKPESELNGLSAHDLGVCGGKRELP